MDKQTEQLREALKNCPIPVTLTAGEYSDLLHRINELERENKSLKQDEVVYNQTITELERRVDELERENKGYEDHFESRFKGGYYSDTE